jgi:hypothetical protein
MGTSLDRPSSTPTARPLWLPLLVASFPVLGVSSPGRRSTVCGLFLSSCDRRDEHRYTWKSDISTDRGGETPKLLELLFCTKRKIGKVSAGPLQSSLVTHLDNPNKLSVASSDEFWRTTMLPPCVHLSDERSIPTIANGGPKGRKMTTRA